MNELLLIYPYDPQGVLNINLIPEEMHKLTSSQGEDYAFLELRKGPFHEKDLVIKDKVSGRTLDVDIDYRLSVPFINDQTKLDCYRIVEIINKDYFDAVLLVTYRTLGSDFVFDELEILEYLATRGIGSRLVHWSSIVEKPGRYTPEEHLHHIKDFFGLNELVSLLNDKLNLLRVKFTQLTELVETHIETPNAHNIELVDLMLHRLKNLYRVVPEVMNKELLTLEEKQHFLTTKVFVDYLEANYSKKNNFAKVHLEGPLEMTRTTPTVWRITNYDSFSSYEVQSNYGTFTLEDEILRGEVSSVEPLGEKTFKIIKDGNETAFSIMLKSAGIAKPSITNIVQGSDDVPLTTELNVTPFRTVPADQDRLVKTIYQFSLDPFFNEIVKTIEDETTVNLDKSTEYFLRVKQFGTIFESQWSDVINFTTVDIIAPNVIITNDVSPISGNRLPHDFVISINDSSSYLSNGLLKAIEYKMNEVTGNVSDRPLIAFSGTKYLNYNDLDPSLNWCPLNTSSNTELGYYGIGGFNESPEKFKSNTEYQLVCRVMLENGTWSDWSSIKTIKTATVETIRVQESETVVEAGQEYVRFYDVNKNIYS